MSLQIKKNDTVLVIAGKEKGKKGRVLSVYPSEGKILIERVGMIKRHMKPSRKYTQGGIIEKEAPIHISNVMLLCPKCEKPTRIKQTILSDGEKVRTCLRCKEVM
jgi:large subunit ribosomal protein L24